MESLLKLKQKRTSAKSTTLCRKATYPSPASFCRTWIFVPPRFPDYFSPDYFSFGVAGASKPIFRQQNLVHTNLNPIKSPSEEFIKRARNTKSIDIINNKISKNTAKGNRIIQVTFIFRFLFFFVFRCFHLTVSDTRREDLANHFRCLLHICSIYY